MTAVIHRESLGFERAAQRTARRLIRQAEEEVDFVWRECIAARIAQVSYQARIKVVASAVTLALHDLIDAHDRDHRGHYQQ